MGKTTGFMDYSRKTSTDVPPLERMETFDEFHIWLSREEQQTQAARCMDCGVPFCQAGMMIGGMASGCPLNNLIPEWNDLVYHGKWELALHRLLATNRFPEFTSRVCPALCEAACTCGDVTGSSVTVRENEHAIIETGYAKGWLHAAPPPARTGKSVALLGLFSHNRPPHFTRDCVPRTTFQKPIAQNRRPLGSPYNPILYTFSKKFKGVNCTKKSLYGNFG